MSEPTDFDAGWYIDDDVAHYRSNVGRKHLEVVDLAACGSAVLVPTIGPRWTIHEHVGVVPLCEGCREAGRVHPKET